MVERRTWRWEGNEEEDAIKLQRLYICAAIVTFESSEHPRQQWQTKTRGIKTVILRRNKDQSMALEVGDKFIAPSFVIC